MIDYSRDEIIEMCKTAIKKPDEFYKYKLVNYTGKTNDDNTFYTEVIAEFLTEENNFARISNIKEYDRTAKKESYNMNHDGRYPDKNGKTDEEFHSGEKIIQIDLFNQCKNDGPFDYIGNIIDYQTPLKAERKDPYGEIDLLAVNKEIGKVFILELKKNNKATGNTSETLLRCILEAYTYYKLVKKTTLLENFGLSEYDVKDIVISPLVFKEDMQYEEWKEIQNGDRPKMRDFINKLDVQVIPFFLEKLDGYKYKVTKE